MPKIVQYTFELPGSVTHDFSFSLNTETFEIETNSITALPEWTELNFCKCIHCPLSEQSHCPVAMNICNIVLPMGSVISYEAVTCKVVTQERVSILTTTAQDALRSLMLFVIATSSCPHTDLLKPMARFHLPFSSLEETISRMVSSYLLFQYFRHEQGHEFDHNLNGLHRLCSNFETIGLAMAQRIRAGDLRGDAGINALVILHNFTLFLPIFLESQLDIIRPAFEPLLKHYDEIK